MGDREIDISFGDEHRALRVAVRTLAREAIQELVKGEEARPEEAFVAMRSRLGDAGILAETVPAAYGGRRDRLDLRAICIVREELAAVSGIADLAFVMQGLGSYPLQRSGGEVLKQEWLPRVASGEATAALALTEEHAGSDIAAIATTALADGDWYILDGEKWFISNAGLADFYCVFASLDPAAGRRGLAAFFVEADRPGLTIARTLPMLASHPLGVLRFENCRIPRGHRLSHDGGGFALAMETLDTFRASVGAAAVGMAARALEEALGFVRVRHQFGKPLAEFQMTQAALAEMAVELDAARLLVYRAAALHDRGDAPVTMEASMAKLFATEAAQRIIDRALQLHGGRGLLRGSVTERLYRDVRALRIYEGTSEIQKLVIAAHLLGRRGRAGGAT
jgi:acyl-CoA dehydrogenase